MTDPADRDLLQRIIATGDEAAFRRLYQRHTPALYDIEGYDHAEIASLLGIDIGTSKSQLSRARRALRRWLEPGWSPS